MMKLIITDISGLEVGYIVAGNRQKITFAIEASGLLNGIPATRRATMGSLSWPISRIVRLAFSVESTK
jgi:hypothetical protein